VQLFARCNLWTRLGTPRNLSAVLANFKNLCWRSQLGQKTARNNLRCYLRALFVITPYFQISVGRPYNFYFCARAQWSHYLLGHAKRPKNAVCIANYSRPVSRNHFQINPSCGIPCKYYTHMCVRREEKPPCSLSLPTRRKAKVPRHNSHPFVRWESMRHTLYTNRL
jgi:hypothetical protein